MDTVDATLLATSTTLFVTIGIFIVQWGRAIADSRRRARRVAILRVVNAVDSTLRRGLSPFNPNAGGERDFALAVPHLYLELSRKDHVVAKWVERQIQRMHVAPTDRQAVTIGGFVAEQLVRWHHGVVKREWFKYQIEKDPPIAEFRVPSSARWKRTGFRSISTLAIGLVIGAVVAPAGSIVERLIRPAR